MTNIVISIDKGVPLPSGAPRTSPWSPFTDKLRDMQPGDSFFIGRATRNDLAGMVRYADRLGVKLIAHEVEDDEVFLLPGVRVWRVDGAPAETPAATPVGMTIVETAVPHGNSESASTPAKAAPGRRQGGVTVSASDVTIASSYWRKADGSCIQFKEPHTPDTVDPGCTPITGDEYSAWAFTLQPEKANPASLYWRYEDGTCTRFKSPQRGLKLAELEEQATPITKAEYSAWEQEQEL